MISVIITTFNRAKFLENAIRSALNQNYKDFELIILDNNSVDNTEEVIKNFPDGRIRYVKHLPLNISQARNLGVKESRGEYVGFLDDDDEWLPNKLDEQVTIFQKSDYKEIGLVYGGFLRIKEDRITEIFTPTLRGDVLKRFLCERNPLTGSASNPLILKSAILAVGGFDDSLKCSEDWEFYLRLARKYSFDFTPKPILKIRHHFGARLGSKLRDALEAELKVFDNFQDVLNTCQEGKSFYLQAIGGKYCRLGEGRKGRKYLKEAIKNSKTNLEAYGQYLLSFFGVNVYSFVHKLYKIL